jgi:hypothetical protein
MIFCKTSVHLLYCFLLFLVYYIYLFCSALLYKYSVLQNLILMNTLNPPVYECNVNIRIIYKTGEEILVVINITFAIEK